MQLAPTKTAAQEGKLGLPICNLFGKLGKLQPPFAQKGKLTVNFNRNSNWLILAICILTGRRWVRDG
jgi:hypothetical protein